MDVLHNNLLVLCGSSVQTNLLIEHVYKKDG